ncbi:MAG: hypothetical protein H0X13_15490 [Ramlibacter sp.]|nr:hypothetical protein [Ramlibacter sp.]
MPGLLDFLSTDDAKLGIALLGASAPSMRPANFAGRLAQGFGSYQAMKDNDLKNSIGKMQIDNFQSEIDARKLKTVQDQRQQDLIASFFPGMTGGAQPAGAGASGAPTASGGGASGGGNDIMTLSQKLGIPPQAIQADLVFNGGKKISEMLAKHGAPDMQVTNGYAYDKNQLGAGFMPQLSTSQDGKTSMVRIGADGLPVVAAPAGALDTFNSYGAAAERTKAQRDPLKVVGADGAERYVTREQVVNQATNPGEAGMRTQAQGGMGADPKAVSREIAATQNDLMKKLDPASRAQLQAHLADLQATQAKIGGNAPFQASPTNAQKLEAEVARTKAVKQTEADVLPTAQRQNAIANANYLTSVIDQAVKHPGRETATGLSGTIDPRNYLPGTHATDFKAVLGQIKGSAFLQAFEALKGGGAITELEGEKATSAIARMNTAQSDKEFEKALNEFRGVVQNGLIRAKSGMVASTGATGSFDGDNSIMPTNGKASAVSTGGWSATLKK